MTLKPPRLGRLALRSGASKESEEKEGTRMAKKNPAN
jgi:hypothetical protein